jgi:hypothetical protein
MWARVLMMVGVFPGMVIWLVWMLTQSVATSIKDLDKAVVMHAAAATNMEHKIDQELENHALSNSLLRQICVSLAENAQARRECSK